MATRTDVRRIALSLPKVVEGKDHFAFSVPNKGKLKGFACGREESEAVEVVEAVMAYWPSSRLVPGYKLDP